MENKEYSRRKFINKCFGSFSVFLGGAVVLQSCNSNDSGEEKKDPGQGKEDQVKSGKPCDDLSGVSATEIEKRQKFGYVDKSPDPERFCNNCSLHLPPGSDNDCLGCMLFKGPVHPEGYCIQYVPKV